MAKGFLSTAARRSRGPLIFANRTLILSAALSECVRGDGARLRRPRGNAFPRRSYLRQRGAHFYPVNAKRLPSRRRTPEPEKRLYPERKLASLLSMNERITFNPEQCGGRPCIRGMRIRVKDVLDLLAAGVSETEILEDFPYLEAADIQACLDYAASLADHPVLVAR